MVFQASQACTVLAMNPPVTCEKKQKLQDNVYILPTLLSCQVITECKYMQINPDQKKKSKASPISRWLVPWWSVAHARLLAACR